MFRTYDDWKADDSLYAPHDRWKADDTLYIPCVRVEDVDGEQDYRGPTCHHCAATGHVSYSVSEKRYVCEPCVEERSDAMGGVK